MYFDALGRSAYQDAFFYSELRTGISKVTEVDACTPDKWIPTLRTRELT